MTGRLIWVPPTEDLEPSRRPCPQDRSSLLWKGGASDLEVRVAPEGWSGCSGNRRDLGLDPSSEGGRWVGLGWVESWLFHRRWGVDRGQEERLESQVEAFRGPSEPQHFHFQHCSCRMNIFYEVLGGRCTGWSEEKLEVGRDSGGCGGRSGARCDQV